MQLSKNYTLLSILFVQTCLLQASETISALEQNQAFTPYVLPRVNPNDEHFKQQAEQCVSSFDTAHYMRYALVPAGAVFAYLTYKNFNNITATVRSGCSMAGGFGRSVWNGVAAVGNFVPSMIAGAQPFTPYPPAVPGADGAAVVVPQLDDNEIKAVRGLLNQWTFLAVASVMAKSEIELFARRAIWYVYTHSFDGGAQNLKLFVDQETSLAEIRFYLRDWLQDMSTVVAESSIESLYDTVYEFDKQVIADAERIIAFMSSLKEYAHMQDTTAVDRKVKMLIDETNIFAEVAERVLNEQQAQPELNRQRKLADLMNRTLTFIALVNREVLSFMRVNQKVAQK